MGNFVKARKQRSSWDFYSRQEVLRRVSRESGVARGQLSGVGVNVRAPRRTRRQTQTPSTPAWQGHVTGSLLARGGDRPCPRAGRPGSRPLRGVSGSLGIAGTPQASEAAQLTASPVLQDGGLLLPVPPGVQRAQADRAHVPEELGRAHLQRAPPAGVPGLQVSGNRGRCTQRARRASHPRGHVPQGVSQRPPGPGPSALRSH